MNTGERIRAARKSAHLSQAELASRVGLSEPAIRLYELGKRTPKPEILTAIAKALGVSSESLEDRRMDSVQDVMEVLFQMEEAGFGIFPINTEDGTVIAIDPTAPHAPKLQMALDEWRKQHEALECKCQALFPLGGKHFFLDLGKHFFPWLGKHFFLLCGKEFFPCDGKYFFP